MAENDEKKPDNGGSQPRERQNAVFLPPPPGGLIPADQVLPPNLFAIPVAQLINFPTMLAPLIVSLPRFIATVEESINRQRMLGLLLTRGDAPVSEKLTASDLHDVGIAAKILKRIKMPDGSVNLLVHCVRRFRAKRVLSETPFLVVESEYLEDIAEKSTEMDALTRTVIGHVKKLSEINPFFTEEMRMAMINAPGPGTVADLVAFALSLPKAEAQAFLETLSVKERFQKLLVHLRREQDVAEVQKKIADDVNTKVSKAQREFFLREQMKTIKKELGLEEDGKTKSSRTFRERIEAAGMPEDVKKVATEELEKFESLSEHSPEYNVTRNYLETLCSLPWSKETTDQLDISRAARILDEEHYGLEKVKERIIEFLSVKKLKNDSKGSIICLVGPPGVGKTSVGKSIAKTLGRNFYRLSLGGMRDEAEIKGHRRTYIGAMPGKVVQAIRRAGSKNAVLMLDEVDKLGASYHGDPASALLEVLDPEQNVGFIDHYVDLPFDLSKVLFICTANTTSTIPAPLLDRMEVIELPGYTLEEKEDIAIRYVIPREIEAAGLKPNQLRIDRAALHRMMVDYSREPGLRTLQQLVGRIARKAAAKFVKITEDGKVKPKDLKRLAAVVRRDDLADWLGPKRYYNETAERITAPGVVVGLAWTAGGGDILFIEASDVPGDGALKLTGQMGEVMSESAAIAWSYVKRKASRDFKMDKEFFKGREYHLHIPAGAIPKDGPSAGITMASALYSLLSGRKAHNRVAMTGELSLIGKVLPVGGIKEKLLAARRAGIETVILPRLNEKDLHDLPAYARKDLKIYFVGHVDEVFDLVLEKSGKALTHPAHGKTKARVLRTKPVKPGIPKKRKTSRRDIVKSARIVLR